jgi:hypothetical protein
MPPATRHLLAVWNPFYATNALARHAELLGDSHRDVGDDAEVWWGLVRSPHRMQPLAHLDEILALDGEMDARLQAGHELQLYLTDYQSLYVADVRRISRDTPQPGDGVVPGYYAQEGLACEAWLALADIRALVVDDLGAVQRELAQLRNVRYHDRRVSLYGGMVELPLLVTRPDGVRFFSEEERRLLNDDRPWVVADAERRGLGEVAVQLRDHLLGEAAWLALTPAARTFVCSAESLLRRHWALTAFDFSPVLVELGKAVELLLNRALPRLLQRAPAHVAQVNVDGTGVDLRQYHHLSLGQLAKLLQRDGELVAWLAGTHGARARWLSTQAPALLGELADHRNPAAHAQVTTRAQVLPLRNQWLGVGCHGQLVELARLVEAAG